MHFIIEADRLTPPLFYYLHTKMPDVLPALLFVYHQLSLIFIARMPTYFTSQTPLKAKQLNTTAHILFLIDNIKILDASSLKKLSGVVIFALLFGAFLMLEQMIFYSYLPCTTFMLWYVIFMHLIVEDALPHGRQKRYIEWATIVVWRHFILRWHIRHYCKAATLSYKRAIQ